MHWGRRHRDERRPSIRLRACRAWTAWSHGSFTHHCHADLVTLPFIDTATAIDRSRLNLALDPGNDKRGLRMSASSHARMHRPRSADRTNRQARPTEPNHAIEQLGDVAGHPAIRPLGHRATAKRRQAGLRILHALIVAPDDLGLVYSGPVRTEFREGGAGTSCASSATAGCGNEPGSWVASLCCGMGRRCQGI